MEGRARFRGVSETRLALRKLQGTGNRGLETLRTRMLLCLLAECSQDAGQHHVVHVCTHMRLHPVN